MRGNDALVFDPGNQFSNDVVPPYFVLPGYWRQFIFRILKPRDLAVYFYISALSDKHGIAYPSLAQMQDELEIYSSTTLTSAIGRLEDNGFILRRRGVLPRQNSAKHQNIYQRPSPHFTLLKLLQLKKIDGDLRPITQSTDDQSSSKMSKPAQTSLRKLLGERLYRDFEGLETAADRASFLIESLQRILEEKRTRGRLEYDLFQGRLSARIVSRLRRSEEQLWQGLSATFKHAVGTSADKGLLQMLAIRVSGMRKRLHQAAEKRDVTAVLDWTTSFDGLMHSLESDVATYLSTTISDAQPALDRVNGLFEDYQAAVAPLRQRIDQERTLYATIPF
jgi:hypothetical protein